MHILGFPDNRKFVILNELSMSTVVSGQAKLGNDIDTVEALPSFALQKSLLSQIECPIFFYVIELVKFKMIPKFQNSVSICC